MERTLDLVADINKSLLKVIRLLNEKVKTQTEVDTNTANLIKLFRFSKHLTEFEDKYDDLIIESTDLEITLTPEEINAIIIDLESTLNSLLD